VENKMKTTKEISPEEKKMPIETSQKKGETYQDFLEKQKSTVIVSIENPRENYERKLKTLQILAITIVLIIISVAIYRLLLELFKQGKTDTLDYAMIGFITFALVPVIIAVFGLFKYRNFCLYISTFIFSVWVFVQSVFFWEMILLFTITIIYFEITQIIIHFSSLIEGARVHPKGDIYYHASIVLNRYFHFILQFSLILGAVSLFAGLIGYFVIEPLSSAFIFGLFVIFLIIGTMLVIRRILTPQMEKILLEKERQKREKELLNSHSRFS
jgi:hypothetical protein